MRLSHILLTQYRDPRRADEQKRTNPTNQAQHWYSHALLKALRLQTAYPQAKVALAFPDFPRYRTLFDETKLSLAKLGIAVLLVNAALAVAIGCSFYFLRFLYHQVATWRAQHEQQQHHDAQKNIAVG